MYSFKERRRVPWQELWTNMGEPKHYVQGLIDIFQEWFDALEDRTANGRVPDPLFFRNGKALITEEYVERVIKALDQEYYADYQSTPGQKVGAEAPPEFNRLEGPARRAFVEAIVAYADKYEKELTAEGVYAVEV